MEKVNYYSLFLYKYIFIGLGVILHLNTFSTIMLFHLIAFFCLKEKKKVFDYWTVLFGLARQISDLWEILSKRWLGKRDSGKWRNSLDEVKFIDFLIPPVEYGILVNRFVVLERAIIWWNSSFLLDVKFSRLSCWPH